MPGYGFRIHLRNDGPPLFAELSYRRLRIENADGTLFAEEKSSDGALRIWKTGEERELFISAESAAALRGTKTARVVFRIYRSGADQTPESPSRAVIDLSATDLAALGKP